MIRIKYAFCAGIFSIAILFMVFFTVDTPAASPKYEVVEGTIIDFKYDMFYGHREPRTWALIEGEDGPDKRVCVQLYSKDYKRVTIGDAVKVTYVPENMRANTVEFTTKEIPANEK